MERRGPGRHRERTPGKRALWGTFPQLGAPLGFIIGNGLFLIIGALLPSAAGADPSQPSDAFLSWGWRIPFLFSAVMVAIGLWVRMRLVESQVFAKTQETGKVRKLPLATVFRHHWKQLVLGSFAMLATYVLFYLMTTFSLSYGRTAEDADVPGLGYSYTTFVLMMIFGVLFFAAFTLISGPLADKYGRRRTLAWVTVGIIVFGLVWVPLINLGTLGVVLWLVLGFTLMGTTFGPMGAMLPELFPTSVRYTGSGIAYNVSSILGAAVAPFVAVALWEAGDGSPWLVGVYLSVMAVLTLTALLIGKETKDIALDEGEVPSTPARTEAPSA